MSGFREFASLSVQGRHLASGKCEGSLGETRQDFKAHPLGIGSGEARPLGDKHVVDPCAKARKRAPEMARHAQMSLSRQPFEVEPGLTFPRRCSLARNIKNANIGIGKAHESRGHRGNRNRGIADRGSQCSCPLVIEDCADAKVDGVESILEQRPETRLREAQTIGAGVSGHSRQASSDEGQIQPQLIETDQAERDFDGIVVIKDRECRRRRLFGHPRDRAKETELVGRQFLIPEEDTADQRQGTCPVVR